MQSIIESFGTQLYEEGNHVGYKVHVKHMIPLWKKWSRNRDPDMERVNEILESRAYIPKFIHLAELEGRVWSVTMGIIGAWFSRNLGVKRCA